MDLFNLFKRGKEKDSKQSPGGFDPDRKDEPEVSLQGLVFKGEKGEPKGTFLEGEPLCVQIQIKVRVPVFFDLNVALSILRLPEQTLISKDNMQRDGLIPTWLPGGEHLIEWKTSGLPLREGNYSFLIELINVSDQPSRIMDSQSHAIEVKPFRYFEGAVSFPHEWGFSRQAKSGEPGGLSWQKGHKDWFFKHFDHAANVVINYMFDNSPLLRGKILDVGCGEGITDLGIFLRVHPELLVGIDIEGNFRELPRIMRDNGLPFSDIPKDLVFRRIDAKKIPYPDDYFDVVISWALLEHVPGGYEEVLREIKRVLKDGGLLFLHPGLYYADSGHHLGEFTEEHFAHLRRSEEELKKMVFTAKPNYMDRGGLRYTPEDFWRFYSELNKITVSEIEEKLRRLRFDFKKVAVRVEDLVIYDEALQAYPIQDLTTREIYMALVNRKG